MKQAHGISASLSLKQGDRRGHMRQGPSAKRCLIIEASANDKEAAAIGDFLHSLRQPFFGSLALEDPIHGSETEMLA